MLCFLPQKNGEHFIDIYRLLIYYNYVDIRYKFEVVRPWHEKNWIP